ncbi:reverse transcriptase domain-containing protein [Tanacetum coccineum]
MILNSVLNGPLVWPTIVEENGLPLDVYAIVNHHKVAKEIWDKVKLLMQGLIVLVFTQGDDPIACLNKAMAFLLVVAASRGNNIGGQARVVKCYNFQGEGHTTRKCTQPKRPRNAAWSKEKAMLTEAQESGQILDEEQLAFLTEDLDAYDSDCDDVSNAKVVMMVNLSDYGSDVISEAAVQDTNLYAQQEPMILSVIEQMSEQMINNVNN